jgi:hypothetical protein
MTDFELRVLLFPKCAAEPTVVWILFMYVEVMWDNVVRRNKRMSLERFVSLYLEHGNARRRP